MVASLHEGWRCAEWRWRLEMAGWSAELRSIECRLLAERSAREVATGTVVDGWSAGSTRAGTARPADGAHAQAAGRAAPGARSYIGDIAVTHRAAAVQADLFVEVA